MSPIVPPSSIIHTLGGALFDVTGICATLCTHSWIASVMCGITVNHYYFLLCDKIKQSKKIPQKAFLHNSYNTFIMFY